MPHRSNLSSRQKPTKGGLQCDATLSVGYKRITQSAICLLGCAYLNAIGTQLSVVGRRLGRASLLVILLAAERTYALIRAEEPDNHS